MLGLVPDKSTTAGRLGTSLPSGSKLFLPPNVADVLPFAADHPFAAWDPSSRDMSVRSVKLRPSASQGWKERPRQTGFPSKKVWSGDAIGMYRVGYERDVQDLEARLHETMWEVAGESHTFTRFAPGNEPSTVLDVSRMVHPHLTIAAGYWTRPMAHLSIPRMADATFVGLDLVPCQTDLSLLAAAERSARSTSQGLAAGQGIWERLEEKVTWEQGDLQVEPG